MRSIVLAFGVKHGAQKALDLLSPRLGLWAFFLEANSSCSFA
jgi:hypothetical protein